MGLSQLVPTIGSSTLHTVTGGHEKQPKNITKYNTGGYHFLSLLIFIISRPRTQSSALKQCSSAPFVTGLVLCTGWEQGQTSTVAVQCSKWLIEATTDYNVGSWPGHLGKGVGKQVDVLAHLREFGSSSRLENKMSPVTSSEGKLGVRCLGVGEVDEKFQNHQL